MCLYTRSPCSCVCAQCVYMDNCGGGDQILLEGLIADILCEHFGEAVELVGVALLRSGPLEFSHLCRICTLNMLKFPRDVVNSFCGYTKSGVSELSWKNVRDALLVLIHFGLVCTEDASGHEVYTINGSACLHRLCFPAYLGLDESQNVAEVLRRGRVVDVSSGSNCLKTVDSMKNSDGISKGVVWCVDTVRVHSRLIVSFLDKFVSDQLGSLAGQIIVQLADEGDLSAMELQQRLGPESVSSVIKLLQMNWICKKSGPILLPKAKVRRTANTKQIQSAEFFSDLVDPSIVPVYSLRLECLVGALRGEIVFNLIVSQFGVECARVFQAVSGGMKLEASHIAEKCAISREDSLKHLHALAIAGIVQIQEVPKVTGSVSSGGVAAMMRAVASSYWVYSVDESKARLAAVGLVAKATLNLRRRLRHEVLHQCRIEDRASSLSESQEAYLRRVHEAQDIIEANSIKLANSLAVLLYS